jgi:Uma2 family endonuclease
MPTATLAQQLLDRPDAFLQLKRINEALTAEKKRRHEFYEWVTEGVKAEFINGEIVVHSPVKRQHWKITDLFSSLLSVYVRIKRMGVVGTEKVMVALTRNDYEPDLVFFSKEKAEHFTDEQVLFPAPDFVVEILSKSTAKVDKIVKKADYAAHGVREYWIVDPVKQRIEQYVLSEGDTQFFPAKTYQLHDTIASTAIAGFEIPVKALFDEAANVQALQQLLSAK